MVEQPSDGCQGLLLAYANRWNALSSSVQDFSGKLSKTSVTDNNARFGRSAISIMFEGGRCHREAQA